MTRTREQMYDKFLSKQMNELSRQDTLGVVDESWGFSLSYWNSADPSGAWMTV